MVRYQRFIVKNDESEAPFHTGGYRYLRDKSASEGRLVCEICYRQVVLHIVPLQKFGEAALRLDQVQLGRGAVQHGGHRLPERVKFEHRLREATVHLQLKARHHSIKAER